MPEKPFKLRMRELREKQLITIAERLLASHGCDRFTINELAAAAGVAKGTVYSHYKSQDDLLRAALTRVSAQLTSRLPTGGDDSARKRLEAYMSVVTSEIVNRSHGHLRYPCCLNRSPCPYGGPSEVAAVLQGVIEEVRAEGVASSGIDAGLAASLFVWLLPAIAQRHRNLAEAGSDLSAMCKFFLNGLLA